MYGVGHLTAARDLISECSRTGGDSETEVEILKRRLDQQNLVIQTLLVMLLEKDVIEEQEFRGWIKRMDELDGARDWRLAEDRTEVACTRCGRANLKTVSKCEHCGAELEPDLVPKRP